MVIDAIVVAVAIYGCTVARRLTEAGCKVSVLSECFGAFGVVITCLKILVEPLLFIVSYKLQRKWVFRD